MFNSQNPNITMVLGFFIGLNWVFLDIFEDIFLKSSKNLLAHCIVHDLVEFKSYFSPLKMCLCWLLWLKLKLRMLTIILCQSRIKSLWKSEKPIWPQIIRNVEKSTFKTFFSKKPKNPISQYNITMESPFWVWVFQGVEHPPKPGQLYAVALNSKAIIKVNSSFRNISSNFQFSFKKPVIA